MEQKFTPDENGLVINGNYYPCNWMNEIIGLITDIIIEKQKDIIYTQPKPAEINLTVNEVAKRVNKSVPTITRHIRLGLLTATKAGGSKSWVITEDNYINYKLNLPKRVE